MDELHSYEDQFGLSLRALSALAVTRMYYDGATDERSSLVEQERILEKSQGFLKKRAMVAGILEIRIGAMKGAPVALPKGSGKGSLKDLVSMTPRAAAKQNLLVSKMGMQSDLRAAEANTRDEARACTDGIKRITAVSRASRTILTDGDTSWLVSEVDEG